MKTKWQKFETSGLMLDSLANRVTEQEEIFTFRSQPLLASLVSCLGLEFELGKSDQDRSSVLLGVDLSREVWETEIVSYEGMIGFRAFVPGREELTPLHEDFAHILHPLSIENGHLKQVVIFPELVARAYAKREIELVVVRDWVKSAFLGKSNLNYQLTNAYELESNIALTQIQLLKNRQLAFTGTHDLGDHLLGASTDAIAQYDPLIASLEETYSKVFSNPHPQALMISYLIAVMLDDLAQPQWYGSVAHLAVVEKSLELMREIKPGLGGRPYLPESFHRLVRNVRDRGRDTFSDDFLQFRRDTMAQRISTHEIRNQASQTR